MNRYINPDNPYKNDIGSRLNRYTGTYKPPPLSIGGRTDRTSPAFSPPRSCPAVTCSVGG
ncbi:MAG: hypothetical protein LBS42_08755 [Tannerella sp.]|nr:hypothetical protein [Tannerella sp.]